MKFFLLTIIFLGPLLPTNAQENLAKQDKKLLKIAKMELEQENYIEAYDIYWDLFETYTDDPEIAYGVGICKLYRRGEEKAALPYLLKAQENKKNKNVLYFLAQAYHVNHKLDEAVLTYEQYKASGKFDIPLVEINSKIQSAIKAKELIANKRNVDIRNIGPSINTQYQESVPVILPEGKGIFFTSRRPGGFSGDKDHLGNYFQDVYYAEYKNMKWQEPINVTSLNSKYHDASVSISHNGSTFISYRTNENISGGDLYYTVFEDSSWGTAKKFGSTVNTEYQELSASLSPDENTLYFSSNRPDGFGGFDLYKVQRLPNGNWGEPMNLGPNINTDKNEDSPFIHADGKTLYFSSDGYVGMGGYDIYESTIGENGIWSTPINIGYPINTVEHDIYFTLSPDRKIGYYSSERPGGFGKEDIYQIRLLDNEDYQKVIHCKTIDEKQNHPIGATITLIDENSHKLNGIYQSNSGSGKFIMVVEPDNLYQVIIEAHGYESKVVHVSFADEEDIQLKIQEFLLNKN